jgi:thiol-disulfide isomerase/thioredoxin
MLEFYILRFVKTMDAPPDPQAGGWSSYAIPIIVSLIIVVSSIGLYYWWTGTPPGATLIEQEPPIESTLDGTQANFMFFYASWCPHCKTAQQPWHSFKQLVKNNNFTYGGMKITFEEINAETDKGKAALYGIQAYPTFKVQTMDKLFEMRGAPTAANFREFLKKALGDEKTA